MRLHNGTLFAGVIYLAVGLAFVAEALDWWTLRVEDLRFAGPLALVVVGIAVVFGSINSSRAT